MMQTRVDAPVGKCLDDNTVGALLDGTLSVAQRRSIEVHVDRCGDCRALLAELAAEGQATQPLLEGREASLARNDSQVKPALSWLRKLTTPSSLLEPGQKIDHYSVIRLLGVGGMGEVYLARDDKLGRKVALKLVNERHLESPSAVERFMREARATARLNHPHIVTIHAVGEYQGKPYLALEYVAGDTLRQWMQKHPAPPLSEVLRIGLAILDAVAEAHRHGILHRDLKPENVLVDSPRGSGEGRVRVVDFGLAEIIEGDDVLDTFAEHAHDLGPIVTGVVGTPRYMAPEQWDEDERSGATDVWAFGLIAYELLSGRHPYAHLDDPMTLSADICSDEPVAPLAVEGVPAEIVEVVSRALAKRPAERPGAEALAASFRGCARRLETEAVLQAHRPIWPWIAAALLLVFGGVTAWFVLREEPDPPALRPAVVVPTPEPPPATAAEPEVAPTPPSAEPEVSASPKTPAAAPRHTGKPSPVPSEAPAAKPPPGDLLKEW